MSSLSNVRIPYGAYWSTPFARWQGSLSHLHSIRFAADTAKKVLAAKKLPEAKADLEKFVATAPPSARELADAKKILEQMKDVK